MGLQHAVIGAIMVAMTSVLTVASATTPAPGLSIIQTPSENISTKISIPVTPIDPRFSIIKILKPDPPLAQNSFLMTAVNEMSKLSLLDWNGRVASFRSERIPGYTDVSIVIRTVPPAQEILTRVAVWGLYAAIDDMRINGRFAASEFYLYWDGSIVGVLRFKAAATSQSRSGGQGDESESEDLILPTLPSVASSIQDRMADSLPSPDTSRRLNDPVFVADGHYVPQAQSLTFEEVLLPIICALRDIAAVPKASSLDAKFLVQPVGIDSKVLFGGQNYGPITSRNTYQYKWAIRTLRAMPIFFLTNNRFAEMYINIIVDGVYLGVGGLDKGEGLADAFHLTS